jgi:competence protein ComGC
MELVVQQLLQLLPQEEMVVEVMVVVEVAVVLLQVDLPNLVPQEEMVELEQQIV